MGSGIGFDGLLTLDWLARLSFGFDPGVWGFGWLIIPTVRNPSGFNGLKLASLTLSGFIKRSISATNLTAFSFHLLGFLFLVIDDCRFEDFGNLEGNQGNVLPGVRVNRGAVLRELDFPLVILERLFSGSATKATGRLVELVDGVPQCLFADLGGPVEGSIVLKKDFPVRPFSQLELETGSVDVDRSACNETEDDLIRFRQNVLEFWIQWFGFTTTNTRSGY